MTQAPNNMESLESAAEYFAKTQFDLSNCTQDDIRYIGGCFIAGATWHKQQSIAGFDKNSNIKTKEELAHDYAVEFCKGCDSAINEDGLCPICDNYLYDHEE